MQQAVVNLRSGWLSRLPPPVVAYLSPILLGFGDGRIPSILAWRPLEMIDESGRLQ
jgi:hypothetical protein